MSPWQRWGLILLAPYAVVFIVFVLYPVGYGLWLARHPASYEKLFDDPIFLRSVFNTLAFLIIAINLKMIVALVLSGFLRRGAHVDQVAVAAVHPAVGGAVDSDDPVDPLHAEPRVGAHQFADLPVHRARTGRTGSTTRTSRWRSPCSSTSGNRCRSGR